MGDEAETLFYKNWPDNDSFTNCRLPKYASLSILIAHEHPDVSDSTSRGCLSVLCPAWRAGCLSLGRGWENYALRWFS